MIYLQLNWKYAALVIAGLLAMQALAVLVTYWITRRSQVSTRPEYRAMVEAQTDAAVLAERNAELIAENNRLAVRLRKVLGASRIIADEMADVEPAEVRPVRRAR